MASPMRPNCREQFGTAQPARRVEGRRPAIQIGREPIWTANGGSRRDETQDGASKVVHRQGETGKTGRKQFCVTPVSRLELCDQTAGSSLGPLQRVAKRRDPGWVEQWPDKTARCRLTTQIQNQSIFKIPNIRPQGTPLQVSSTTPSPIPPTFYPLIWL